VLKLARVRAYGNADAPNTRNTHALYIIYRRQPLLPIPDAPLLVSLLQSSHQVLSHTNAPTPSTHIHTHSHTHTHIHTYTHTRTNIQAHAQHTSSYKRARDTQTHLQTHTTHTHTNTPTNSYTKNTQKHTHPPAHSTGKPLLPAPHLLLPPADPLPSLPSLIAPVTLGAEALLLMRLQIFWRQLRGSSRQAGGWSCAVAGFVQIVPSNCKETNIVALAP
jgi:hypothetical protein